MKQKNFELLSSQWPELYKHATLAEQYIYSDPATGVIKLRCFIEALVGTLYRELQLPSDPAAGLFEKLKSEHFESVIENPIRQKMHAIRCHGNRAAHGKEVDNEQAVQLLKEAYLLGRWLYTTCNKNLGESYPDFVEANYSKENETNLNASNKLLIQQLEQAKKELEEVQTAELVAQKQISALSVSLDEARLTVFRNASSRASNNMDLQEETTRRLLRIEDAFAEYKLTIGQRDLVKRIGEFLSSNSESIFLLRGYAGTGKTFITKGLTEYFQSIGRNYVLAAPTGKAAKVIANKTQSAASTLHKTIYSFKDIAEYKDDNLDGTETYKFYAKLAVNEMPADTVFIVDEASMVSDVYSETEFFRFGSGYLLRDFLKYVNLDHNDHHKKVIFIGDDAQLPPVGMKFSPALDANYLLREQNVRSTSFELTEVVRQKGESGVLKNATMLRESLQQGIFNQLSVLLQTPDVTKVEHIDLMDRYLESCGGKINGESIVIANSNADVAAYNRRIREYFFPGHSEIAVHDKIMAMTNSRACGFLISNGDFGIIKQILGETERRNITIKRKNKDNNQVEDISVELSFRQVVIGFRDEGASRFFEAKILEHFLYSDQPSLSSDENKALYVDFCIRNPGLTRGSLEFKNTLMSDPYFNALRLKFGYAITCHKAQGSEWNNVFVKCTSNQNQLTAGYFRWFYTAITRASQNLWLLDPPIIKIGSGIKAVHNPGMRLQQVHASIAPLEPPVYESAVAASRAHLEQSAGPQHDSSNTFGIPNTGRFLLELLSRIKGLTEDSGICIDDIAHHQYHEAYMFRRGDDFAKVLVWYNGKEKVTSIKPSVTTVLSSAIQSLLFPLVGAPIATVDIASVDQTHFDKDFLNELHQRLAALATEQGIKIQKVVRLQWSLRYTFVRENEMVVFDIYFDGKQRFTKCQPQIAACSPGQLIDDVMVLLTQELNA